MAAVEESNDAEKINRLRVELEFLRSENDNLRTELFQTGENLKFSQNNIIQLNSSIANLHAELQQKSQKMNDNVNEKFELGHMIEAKNREINKLKAKICELNNSSFERYEELNSSLTNARHEEIRLKFEERILQNEKVLYKKQTDLLGKQLEEKTSQLLNLQTEIRSLNANLNEKISLQNGKISTLTHENTKLKSMLESCEKNFADTFGRYQQLLQEHSEMKNVIDRQRENYENHTKILKDKNQDLEQRLQQEEDKCKDYLELFENQSKIHDELEEKYKLMKHSLELMESDNQKLKLDLSNLMANQRPLLNLSSSQHSFTSSPTTARIGSSLLILGQNSAHKMNDCNSNDELLDQVQELEKENQMLSNQVRHLLKSDLQARGMPVSNGFKRTLPSTVCIPDEEITFSDICQLQERNIELLKTLQIYYDESDSKALKEEIELLKCELEEKKEALKKSDSYSWKRDFLEVSNELKRVKSEHELVQKKLEDLKNSSHESIRKLEEEKNTLFEENVIQKANLWTINAERQMANKDLEALEIVKSEVYQENCELRELNIKLTSANENMKLNSEVLKDEVQSQKEKVKDSEQKISMLEAQLDMHRNNEQLLLNEKIKLEDECQRLKSDGFTGEREDLNQSNVTAIMSSEAKEILKNQIEELQNNNKYYRQKIDRQEEKLSTTIQDFSNRIQKFQAMLEKEKTRYTLLQKEFLDLDVKYQELLEKNANNQSKSATDNSLGLGDDGDDPSKAAAHDIYRLKQMIKIAEDHAAANEKAKLQLEVGIKEIADKHREELEEMQKRIDSKLEEIQRFKAELLAKDDEIEAVAAKKDGTIGQLREEIKQWKEEMDTVNNVAEVNHRSMEQILTEQQKLVQECDDFRQINKCLQDKIDDLKGQLTRSEAALKVYKENGVTWNSDSGNGQHNSIASETMEKEYSNLKEYTDLLLWQIEELKAKVEGNNDSGLNSLDADPNSEQGLIKVVKFLREKLDEAQKSLRQTYSEINALKVHNSNLNKEIEQMKISVKRTDDSGLNESTIKELYGKASLVEMLTAKNAKLDIELQRCERVIRNMNLNLSRAEKYQDEAQDLVQKARERAIENQALKAEILGFKKRMAKIENRMSQVSAEAFEALCNEKEELEKKVQVLEVELSNYRAKSIDADKKYIMLKGTLLAQENQAKDEISKFKNEKTKLETELATSKDKFETLKADLARSEQHLANFEAKSEQAIDDRIVRLQAELDKANNEKEIKLKQLAEKVKEKISQFTSQLHSKQEEIDTLKNQMNKTLTSVAQNSVSVVPNSVQNSVFDPKEGSSRSQVSVAPLQSEFQASVFKPPMASIKPTISHTTEPRTVLVPGRTQNSGGRQMAAVTPNVEESPAIVVAPQVVPIQPISTRIEPTIQVSEASTSFSSAPSALQTSATGNDFLSTFSFSQQSSSTSASGPQVGEKRTLESNDVEDDDECSSSKKVKVLDEEMLDYENDEQVGRRADELMASSEEEVEVRDSNSLFAPQASDNDVLMANDESVDVPEESGEQFKDEAPLQAQEAVENEQSSVPEEGEVHLEEEEDVYEEELENEDENHNDNDDDNDMNLVDHQGTDDHHVEDEEDAGEEDEEACDDEEEDDDDEDDDEEDDDTGNEKEAAIAQGRRDSVPEVITLSDSDDDDEGDSRPAVGEGVGEANAEDNSNPDDDEVDDDDEDDADDDEDDGLVVDDEDEAAGNVNVVTGENNTDDNAEQAPGISSSDTILNDQQVESESQTSSNTLTTSTTDDGLQSSSFSFLPSVSGSQLFPPMSGLFQQHPGNVIPSSISLSIVPESWNLQMGQDQQQQPDSHDEDQSAVTPQIPQMSPQQQAQLQQHLLQQFALQQQQQQQQQQQHQYILYSQQQQQQQQQEQSQFQQPQSVIISQSSAFVSGANNAENDNENDAQPSESGNFSLSGRISGSGESNDVASSSTQATSLSTSSSTQQQQQGQPNSSSGSQDEAQPEMGSSNQEDRDAESPEASDESANRTSAKPRRGFRRGNYGF